MATPFFHVDVQQPAEMRFNRARVRRAFVTIGQRHMRDARRLVMRRARSAPGENPGYQTGRLARSIGYMVPGASKKRAGFMTRIAPNQRNGKGNRMISGDFYPAFLFFGVRGGAKRRRSHHRGASGGSGWRLAPRQSYPRAYPPAGGSGRVYSVRRGPAECRLRWSAPDEFSLRKVPVRANKPAKTLRHVEFLHFRNRRAVFVKMADKHQHPQTNIIRQV